MAEEAKIQSKFQFTGYRVINSSLSINEKSLSDKLQFNITPNGEFKDGNNFELTLSVVINDNSPNLKISLVLKGYFHYETSDKQQLIGFLGCNAPAIMYPYIRSYISCLTGLSGIKPIIMPTLNLEPVGQLLVKRLKENEVK